MSQYGAWCKQRFAMMTDGGSWAIPRSGIIFQRRGRELVMIAKMPWQSDMPVTREQLDEQQQGDFDATKREFEAVGIAVSDETSPPKPFTKSADSI